MTRNTMQPTWADLVYGMLKMLNRECTGVKLSLLYRSIDGHEKTKSNPTWKATVRRTLQQHPKIEPVRKGVWRIVPDEATET